MRDCGKLIQSFKERGIQQMCCFVILLLFNEMQMSVRRFSAIPHLRAPLASSKRMLIVSHMSTLDEAHSWSLVCSLVKRMLTISHTSTFHGACEISKHPSARTASFRSFYLRFSFLIVRLRFFRHAVLNRIINSQARQVNVTDNTTRSQSTFFREGRLGGRVL